MDDYFDEGTGPTIEDMNPHMKRPWYVKPGVCAGVGLACALGGGYLAHSLGEKVFGDMLAEHVQREYSKGDELMNTVFLLSDQKYVDYGIVYPAYATLAGAGAGLLAGAGGALKFFGARDRETVLGLYQEGMTDPSLIAYHTGFSPRKVEKALRKLEKKGLI